MAARFLLFVEGKADAATVEALVDRVLAEGPDAPSWVTDSLESSQVHPSPEQVQSRGAVRLWVGEDLRESPEATAGYVDVHGLVQFAGSLRRDRGFSSTRGHFHGVPGKHASKLGRKAFDISVEVRRRCNVDAAILVQDMDTDPSRRDGLKLAREEAAKRDSGMALLLGCPNQCREAWVLAAFEPTDDAETVTLTRERKALGFNPCTSSERLHHGEKRTGAKAVLARLTRNDGAREKRALRTMPLELMRARGRSNGLEAFLDEVNERLCPVVHRR